MALSSFFPTNIALTPFDNKGVKLRFVGACVRFCLFTNKPIERWDMLCVRQKKSFKFNIIVKGMSYFGISEHGNLYAFLSPGVVGKSIFKTVGKGVLLNLFWGCFASCTPPNIVAFFGKDSTCRKSCGVNTLLKEFRP
jgi:hypothetical protein